VAQPLQPLLHRLGVRLQDLRAVPAHAQGGPGVFWIVLAALEAFTRSSGRVVASGIGSTGDSLMRVTTGTRGSMVVLPDATPLQNAHPRRR
jgi:hypothetical protein